MITFLSSCSKTDDVIVDDYSDLPNLNERLFSGGETTVFLTSSNSFSTPSTNMFGLDLDNHLAGDPEFEAAFVSAPSLINQGVGPIFSNNSCISCHAKDGRSAFPNNLNSFSGFLVRTSIPGTNANGGPKSVPGFGTQIQNQAIFGYQPEAKIQVSFSNLQETFADGTQVTLKKPVYSFFNTYIPMPADAMFSPRLATPVFGLGLLEAISDSDLLLNQDINDTNNDGISGKANYVFDLISGMPKIGKFGWKANTATIKEQCAAAYNNDMGITNYILSQETGYGQTNGSDGLGDDPELDNDVLDKIIVYCQTLGVPASRNFNNVNVRKGAKIFDEIQCASCHIPKQKSGFSAIASNSNQIFFPYSDLLLHDMGSELADNRPDYLASGTEWKTRPLWGIGLTQVVNGHTNFLHDGRAKNVEEAILWHGGEALKAKNKYKQLPVEKRNQLLEFINSL